MFTREVNESKWWPTLESEMRGEGEKKRYRSKSTTEESLGKKNWERWAFTQHFASGGPKEELSPYLEQSEMYSLKKKSDEAKIYRW